MDETKDLVKKITEGIQEKKANRNISNPDNQSRHNNQYRRYYL